MKILKKQEAIERKNSEICIVTDYPTADESIDFAVVKVSGRYPQSGNAVNSKCKEIVYIHKGDGKVVVENKEHSLQAGDLILIEAGERFYWDGYLELFISCHPAFSVEQHQLVE